MTRELPSFLPKAVTTYIYIVYLTQNVFLQGKACKDIALNTQYLALFNNPIDRQQVATLARRIYPSTRVTFIRKYEDAMARPFGYLVLDLKLSTSDQNGLQQIHLSDDEDADSVESLDYIHFISPPGKERDESYKSDIWNRRVSDLNPPGK